MLPVEQELSKPMLLLRAGIGTQESTQLPYGGMGVLAIFMAVKSVSGKRFFLRVCLAATAFSPHPHTGFFPNWFLISAESL